MNQLKIVVNTRMLLKNRLDGIGRYAYETLKRTVTLHKDVKFIFLFDREYSDEFVFGDNVTPIVLYPPTRHALLNYIWFQFRVKSFLNKTKPDLFLSPDGILCIGSKCKQLAVIHDLNFFHYPKDLPFSTSIFFNYYFPRYAKEATRIATVSLFTKKDLIKEYGVKPDKIDITYNGVDDSFCPINEEKKNAIKKIYTDNKNYFLFVGSIHPRKNITRLLKAFDLFKKDSNSDMKLVIAGSFFWGKKEIDAVLKKMNHKDDVIFTGRISDDSLKNLVPTAFCLSYVPYFEGFGVPLLEAMRSEIPIISANVTSMPEVAGNAALYVDPFNIEEIKNAMEKIYTNKDLRNRLIENGKKQSKKFSWDESAKSLWRSIERSIIE